MSYTQIDLFSFSVFIAAIIALIRYDKICPEYYPFIFCMWVASLNEIFSYFIVKCGYTTAVNNSVYNVLEMLLITWQFRRWGLFYTRNTFYSCAFVVIIIAWVMENSGNRLIATIGAWFHVAFILAIIFKSIDFITQSIVDNYGRLLRNSIFLISLGYVCFFSFEMLTEVYTLF
ncbi:MAG: hypothetical protein JWP81_1087 [Ferruginibacter sp.]|nr:hypothetical protein [Ferruginibacter sp.]